MAEQLRIDAIDDTVQGIYVAQFRLAWRDFAQPLPQFDGKRGFDGIIAQKPGVNGIALLFFQGKQILAPPRQADQCKSAVAASRAK